MNNSATHPEDKSKQVSRRNMLRNSAIAATGLALAPPLLTGCYKDAWSIIKEHKKGGGLGATPLTLVELKAAADNLNRMRLLLADLYQHSFDYDDTVFKALSSTRQNKSWTNFIVDVLIDIAAAMASAAAIAAQGPLAVPAIACMSAFLHDWGIGKDVPLDLSQLNGFFSEYQGGQLRMASALDHKLGHLTEVTNNYANLQEAWKDPISFNGKSWTLKDLADSFFPDREDHADEYYQIYDPMYLHHRKSVWNLAVMKCCSYYENFHKSVVLEYDSANHFTEWARGWYRDNPGVYIRGYITEVRDRSTLFTFCYWNLGIDAYPFPPAAVNELFMDDTPGNMINLDEKGKPKGLFPRSYVFQQFSTTKPDWKGFHELASDGTNFAPSDDFVFTGGLFPKLIQP